MYYSCRGGLAPFAFKEAVRNFLDVNNKKEMKIPVVDIGKIGIASESPEREDYEGTDVIKSEKFSHKNGTLL